MRLTLHRSQAQVFQDSSRFRLLVASRRWGKSRLLLTEIINAALSFNQPIDPASPPVVLLACPTLKQAKQIHWQPLLNLLENQSFISNINKSDYRIEFKGNKPSILLRGTNDSDGDSLRGLKLYYAGLDEIQDIKEVAWEEAIYPALADTPGSRFLGIGTPKGVNHWLHNNLYKKALDTPGWAYHHFTALDNPFLPSSFIRRARKELPDRVFRQEFLADWVTFAGALFDCLCDRHLIEILPSEYDSVYLGLDHGPNNPCITVIGLKDGRYFLIDYWDNPNPQNSVTSDQVVEQAAKFAKRYSAYRCYSPDDRKDIAILLRRYGKQRSIPGLQKAVIFKRNEPGVMPGVEIMNSLFHQDRLYINKKLKALINDFRSYRRDQDRAGNFIDKPAKDCRDHTIDAARAVLSTLEYKHLILAA